MTNTEQTPDAPDLDTTAGWLREAGRRIGRGSGRLCTLYARRTAIKTRAKATSWWNAVRAWLGEATGLGWVFRVALLLLAALLLRKIVLAVAVSLAHRADGARWLLWPLAAVWIIAAYRVGAADWQPPADEDEETEPETGAAEETTEQPETPADEPAPERPAEPLLPNVHDLREALARVGTPHAHITVLAEDIGTTPERVREALAKWGVPVEAVRMRGRGSSTGIRGERFPAPPPAQGTPSDDVVAAGQPTNNNNNPTVVRSSWGLTVKDPTVHRNATVRHG